MKTILITGGAGFIGSNLADTLLARGEKVIVVDSFDDYYSPAVKSDNIQKALQHPSYKMIKGDIQYLSQLVDATNPIDVIVHLAAKVGVRPSLEHPDDVISTNVNGTLSILEFAKTRSIKKVVFASSSSVYGKNNSMPWVESDLDLQPISPYAASKIAGEKLGYVYSHLYDIRFIALRFFTVYGPRQRPDLAIHKLVKSIVNSEKFEIFGDGSTQRDYTFIDDIVSGIISAIEYEGSKFETFNLGNNHSIPLIELVKSIENILADYTSNIEYTTEKPGDVSSTCASIEKSQRHLNYNPEVTLKSGLEKFIEWYLEKVSVIQKRV